MCLCRLAVSSYCGKCFRIRDNPWYFMMGQNKMDNCEGTDLESIVRTVSPPRLPHKRLLRILLLFMYTRLPSFSWVRSFIPLPPWPGGGGWGECRLISRTAVSNGVHFSWCLQESVYFSRFTWRFLCTSLSQKVIVSSFQCNTVLRLLCWTKTFGVKFRFGFETIEFIGIFRIFKFFPDGHYRFIFGIQHFCYLHTDLQKRPHENVWRKGKKTLSYPHCN